MHTDRIALIESLLGREIPFRFVSVAEALRLAPGAALRDLAALEDALHVPMRAALAGEGDPFELAAQLAQAVLQAQALTQDNDLAARAAAALLLRKNGVEFTPEASQALEKRLKA